MGMKSIAIIQFPGTNCERETAVAFESLGLSATIIRWNAPLEDGYGAYVIPGGFSYQDRVRAGAIAAKLPISRVIQSAAHAGKPVLGICNGCQILCELGLIPDPDGRATVSVGMAKNRIQSTEIGFICDWAMVKFKNPTANIWTRYFSETEELPVAINHGEGRFVLNDATKNQMADLPQLLFSNENPNGSNYNLAGLSNSRGNVWAMMPHPERGAFLRQIPGGLPTEWSARKRLAMTDHPWSELGPWAPMFRSVGDYLRETKC